MGIRNSLRSNKTWSASFFSHVENDMEGGDKAGAAESGCTVIATCFMKLRRFTV